MKQLAIDWHALETAFDDLPDEFGIERSNYFDLESGQLVFVDEQVRDEVNCIIDELDESTDLTDDAFRGTDTFQRLSEFERSSVLAALRIEYGDPQQFEEVPNFDSSESYKYMQDFIETVSDHDQQSRLAEAIGQRKPFRRFRDVLTGDRRLERQWCDFEAAHQPETIIERLHSIGVKPTNPEAKTYDPPPLPDLRTIMFAEVRRFVRLARDIEGVRQIALIGSLTTDKEFPKDIDVLLTVSDDCDLAPLAHLGRQLMGHMNSHRAGADVFLTSEHGDYIGRTCPWKDCGPGYRKSCDALHCGERPYLHDDLNVVNLKKEVIAEPRVLLWPILAAAAEVPPDVREQLIDHLAKDEQT
jgi:hypothetical protein